jgi:hypothetical protein
MYIIYIRPASGIRFCLGSGTNVFEFSKAVFIKLSQHYTCYPYHLLSGCCWLRHLHLDVNQTAYSKSCI